jgi:hypothetical protein
VGLTQKLPKKLAKPTDMTIHWKALDKHFLMVPFNHFQGDAFSEFFSKNLSP